MGHSQMLTLQLLTLTLLSLVLSAPPKSRGETKEGDDYFVGIGGNVFGGYMNNNGVVGVAGNIIDGNVNQGPGGNLGVGGSLYGGQFDLHRDSGTFVRGHAVNSLINHGYGGNPGFGGNPGYGGNPGHGGTNCGCIYCQPCKK